VTDASSLRRELVAMRMHLTHKCKIEGIDLALLGAVELLLRVIDGTEADTSALTVEIFAPSAPKTRQRASQAFPGDPLSSLLLRKRP